MALHCSLLQIIATLTATPYPPFALASVSTMGLSAYLIYVGIYSAGISMSGDINLRQTIRKSAIEEAKLLVSIGSAQMQQQLEKKVLENARSNAETMTTQILESNYLCQRGI